MPATPAPSHQPPVPPSPVSAGPASSPTSAIGGSVDVVVVGARPAGAATAMLLARAGHDVLVLDRDRPGRDTLSTHALMRGAVVQLDRWGLLDEVVAAGTPALDRVVFDYAGQRTTVDLAAPLYAPRRTVLDPILAGAAILAGADVRYGTRVEGVLRDRHGRVVGVGGRDPDGQAFEVRADLVVGADGRSSTVARAVGAVRREVGRHSGAGVYAYLEGLDADGIEWFYGTASAAGVIPTNDGLTCVFAATDRVRFPARAGDDLADTFDRLLRATSPILARRVADARRSERLRGWVVEPGWLRQAHGPGWALVGDAGFAKDPITAHGITDALRDAELLARAVHDGLSGTWPVALALERYQAVRDEVGRPFLKAGDDVIGHRGSIEALQRHHLDLSAAMQRETELLRDLDDHASTVAA